MSIGEFARLSRLSPKALRLYDELGLLPPAEVDPDSGYRWYAAGQLDNARLVASLRQIGVPLTEIKVILSLEPEAAAAQVSAYWSETEADHAARRDLVGYLVDRLTGKRNVMFEVVVRDIPARSLLCLLRHASTDQEVWDLGKEVIGMLKAQPVPVPRIEGVAGAAFLVYYGEVNQDSDGPVEFCWPVPQDQAGRLAASLPGLTLRTEPAHQEASVHLDQDATAAQWQAAGDSALAWAAEQQRQPSDLPLRITLLTTAAPVTDASRCGGSDFALPLRDRAGAA
ncbi:MAG TPA: helix-turn-helix domain-containing protein [Streptosporangiaceae bacterium]|nr:helix-turn-helix domain-containing protein [Streptosporangiaceae bacterium]